MDQQHKTQLQEKFLIFHNYVRSKQTLNLYFKQILNLCFDFMELLLLDV